MLNAQRLIIFREVAERRSFSAAADALSYSQPAVSQAVATLEAELGVTLIERDRRGVREKLGPGIRRVGLLEDPMHVALPAGHSLAEKPKLRLTDLRDESWVQTSIASPCAQHVVRSCHAAGFEPTVSFESDDYQTVQGLVAAGVGVALIPSMALSTVRDDIVVRDLSPKNPVRRVIAAMTKTPRSAPAAEA